MTLDCPALRPQWHMTAKRWHEWWNTAMSPCVCVKKWATSVGQWRSSVCCSESHYSYTFIISSFSPLRIDILIAVALCCVTRGTFVPINRQLRSARSHSRLLWLETKRLTSYAVPRGPREKGSRDLLEYFLLDLVWGTQNPPPVRILQSGTTTDESL